MGKGGYETQLLTSLRNLGLIQWGLRFSENRRAQILSPDWLPRLDVNGGWGRHITGEDVNPHMEGSLKHKTRMQGPARDLLFYKESSGCPVPCEERRKVKGRSC